MLIIGEMGLANTTAATAMSCALQNLPASELTGPGTGLDAAGVAHKVWVINRILALHTSDGTSGTDHAKEILRRMGGLEIAAMVGAYLAVARTDIVLLIDGYIATAALLIAVSIDASVRAHCIFAHTSGEPGHQHLLAALNAVRHTPVVVAAGTCYGRTDVPLDDAKFAQVLPSIHAQLPLHAVMVCSPLSRCLHLANALQALAPGRCTVVEPNLIERDFGAWEGKLWDDIARQEIDMWAADYLNFAPPNGESVAAMAQRSALATLNHRRADVPLIVVSHAGPLAAIAAPRGGTVLSANTRSQPQGAVVELRQFP